MVNAQGGSEWWQSHVGKDLSSDFPTKPRLESVPDQARQGRPNPRKDFEENVLKNVSRAQNPPQDVLRPMELMQGGMWAQKCIDHSDSCPTWRYNDVRRYLVSRLTWTCA